MSSLTRWMGLVLVLESFGCAASESPEDDDDGADGGGRDAGDGVDSGGGDECADVDGDGYGVGRACAGDDCDEGNPQRQDGCGEDCAATPEDVGCPCETGAVVSCFDADSSVAGIGICLTGLRHCESELWGYCRDQVLPREEDPLGRNELDDDCNGLVDDELCGEASDCGGSCCKGEEVCLGNHCEVAGDCAVDGNCDDDTYCSPEGCVPYQEGETNFDCDGDIVNPVEPILEFEPDIQCVWGGAADEVIVPPLIVDLDDSPDGVIEPEIIIAVADLNRLNTQIVALSGSSCEERFRTNVQGLATYAPPAIGDLDNDGTVEIVAVTANDGVAVFDDQGDELWRAGAGALPSCCIPALIANLDGRGDAEILVGMRAFDSGGEEIWNVVAPPLAPWGIVPVVADVDLDGQQEVVTGNQIIDGATGEVEENFAELANGQAGIADFDKTTPEPEIAVVSPTGARIQRISGEVIFGPNDIHVVPGSYFGGPPAVADFDGDGQVEFGSAGGAAYVVFDPDCGDGWERDGLCESGRDDGILWQKATQDGSSGSTGSSVFDFDFDGVNEVVYNDECFLRVYDGITGDTRFVQSNTTRTAYEYPVIADVDGDGQTEIVVAANDWPPNTPCVDDDETGQEYEGANRGITVWRDIQDRWAPTRRVWNQHSYSVTNVDEDGSIPAAPENNWSVVGLNNFRVNTRDDPASAERGVDLTGRAPAWIDACPELITLTAVVANRGIRRAPRGISVGFYVPAAEGGPEVLACQTRTIHDIPSGLTETVTCDWVDPPVVATDVHVWVDDTDALVECEEQNNDATITDVRCEGID